MAFRLKDAINASLLLRKGKSIMFKKSHIAVMFVALLAAGAAGAQPSQTGLTREQVQADLVDWNKAGLAGLSHGESGPDTFSPQYRAAFESYLQLRQGVNYHAPSSLQRAQVQADLHAWKRAGLDELSRSESGVDISSSAYQAAHTHYLQMSQGEKYQQAASLTRTEVLTDLKAWKLAGLDQFWSAEHTPDTTSPAYRDAFARYQQLRR